MHTFVDLGLNCFQFYSANEMSMNSEFWTLHHNHSYCHKKKFLPESRCWILPMGLVLRKEKKKSKIRRQLLNHLMNLAGGWKGRGTGWKCHHLLSAPRGNLLYSAAANMPWPILVCYLPFLLRDMPGTAGELLMDKQKEALILQDGKRYNWFQKS